MVHASGVAHAIGASHGCDEYSGAPDAAEQADYSLECGLRPAWRMKLVHRMGVMNILVHQIWHSPWARVRFIAAGEVRLFTDGLVRLLEGLRCSARNWEQALHWAP